MDGRNQGKAAYTETPVTSCSTGWALSELTRGFNIFSSHKCDATIEKQKDR